MVVDPNEAVPMDGEDDEDDASGWRARIKDYYRKLLSPARY
jgi:hypothetical protein